MIKERTGIDVIPSPRTSLRHDSTVSVSKANLIDAPKEFAFEASQLRHYMEESGVEFGKSDGLPIRFVRASERGEELGKEGYALVVSQDGVTITSAHPAGAWFAVQTLRYLLPVGKSNEIFLPAIEIVDRPKFVWRGFMLDVSRHFYTVDEIKGIIDLLSYHKLNVLHWHLTDDGGWRAEIKRYPKLTEIGAWRTKKEFVWDYLDIEFPGPDSGKPLYGGFYTQDEMREVVRYAAERHIDVVPEIEMPGHSLEAIWSYPEYACTARAVEIFRKEVGMPEANVFCIGKEETFTFLCNVLDEVMEIFPSKYVHIGADEVFKVLWENCDVCKERMKQEGLANVDELQSYFVRRIEKHFELRGRTLVGWDEILQGGLAPNAVVMSWRGTEGGIEASKAGHDVVMCPYSHCYFDFGYDKTPTEHVLDFQPVTPEMSEEQASHVLGGQANLWTEYVPDLESLYKMMFPRLASLAEVLWSGAPERDDFRLRLTSYRERLRSMGVHQNED
jgi:hexosaminidase